MMTSHKDIGDPPPPGPGPGPRQIDFGLVIGVDHDAGDSSRTERR